MGGAISDTGMCDARTQAGVQSTRSSYIYTYRDGYVAAVCDGAGAGG